jgi:hypothetical protein
MTFNSACAHVSARPEEIAACRIDIFCMPELMVDEAAAAAPNGGSGTGLPQRLVRNLTGQ